MDYQTLLTLQWDKWIELAKTHAKTTPGQNELQLLLEVPHWAQDVAECNLLQEDTLSAVELLDCHPLWASLEGCSEYSDIIERLEHGQVLSVEDCATLRKWAKCIEVWLNYPKEDLGQGRMIQSIEHLMNPTPVLKVFFKILEDDGSLSENASPAIGQLIREIRNLKQQIDHLMDQMKKELFNKGVLQDQISDFSEGHYLLPVKVSAQTQVDGVIYGKSVSKQTVFVEPKEVELLHLKLREKETLLSHEIYKLLLETSKTLMPYAQELDHSIKTLVAWDVVYAKAVLAKCYFGHKVKIIHEKTIQLIEAAHPLLYWSLDKRQVVKNKVHFGVNQNEKILLITGPNTGGKTVLLKMLGFLACCSRTGFLFSLGEGSSFPFFDSIFIDLGDAQSIEKQLSSFSGHILTLKTILEKSTSRSLILFDELNSTTDPQEGGALSRAVLEELIEVKDALIVATTHDPYLKSLGLTDNRILNASMEFNEKELTPSYELRSGVPGRSRALEVAQRLGINSHILRRARSYLQEGFHQQETLLKELDHLKLEAVKLRDEANYLNLEAVKYREEWALKAQKGVKESLSKVKSDLENVLTTALEEIRAHIRNKLSIKTLKEAERFKKQLVEIADNALGKFDQQIGPSLQVDKEMPNGEFSSVEVGDWVEIPKWKSKGKVLTVEGNQVQVVLADKNKKLSAIKMNLKIDEIIFSEKNAQKSLTHKLNFNYQEEAESNQLDLRGERFEEAMQKLELYLDRAFRSKRAMVTIVHGFGTGAIREGTRALLAKLPFIKSYQDAHQNQGGAGVTVVEFERI